MANIDEAEIRKAVAVLEDGYETHKACNCLKIRQCLQNIQKSGLSDALERMTFDSYQCSEPWQGKEMDTAFEIINARYSAGKRTILSSETVLQDLFRLDGAVAGRIRERCENGAFVVQISKNTGRNHRLTAK